MKFIWQPAKNGCGKKKDSKESFVGLNEDAMAVLFVLCFNQKEVAPIGATSFYAKAY